MKYPVIFFDYGDTLAVHNNQNQLVMNNWVKHMIRKLYMSSYRLGIISNTFRYQDAHWIRNELSKIDSLSYFEMIIASSIYGVHKPSYKIFQKAIDFMDVDPKKCLMVGDSERCDGACETLDIKYMRVEKGEHWENRLYQLLEDDFSPKRKLSRASQFDLNGNIAKIKLHHLSESINVGDRILLGQEEYEIVESNKKFTKNDVLKSDDTVEFKVIKTNAIKLI